MLLNGSNAVSLSDVEPYTWNGTEDRSLYLGKSRSLYFSGYIDEVIYRRRAGRYLVLLCFHDNSSYASMCSLENREDNSLATVQPLDFCCSI